MVLSIVVCLVAYSLLLWILRRDRVSLGLPFAYLSVLLLIHVPGALAHVYGAGALDGDQFVAIGIRYTAIGAVFFVVGVGIAHLRIRPEPIAHIKIQFQRFCVVGGVLFVIATSSVSNIPSVDAIIDRGGAVWVLGALIGLRAAAGRRDIYGMACWLTIPVVFMPVQFFMTGFLSYATTDIIIVGSVLILTSRRYWHVGLSIVILAVLGLNAFVNYFENRDTLRASVGLNGSIATRHQLNGADTRGLHLLDLNNRDDLVALDQRLNQNLFVGLAATRIELGAVDYTYGHSVIQGFIALIPRVIWPDKPVFGGSPQIVAEMTGLRLNQDTSFGVGNVMEFYINFGIPSLVIGFLLLGWGIAFLDIKAAQSVRFGRLDMVFLYFLTGNALIQPNGSIVEMSGGAAAAAVAAYVWRGAWRYWSSRSATARRVGTPAILVDRR